MPVEKVSHPDHYNSQVPGVECITVVEHFNFNRGNAIKYIWQAGSKPGEEELCYLKKAIWYLQREVGLLENNLMPPIVQHYSSVLNGTPKE